MTHDKTGGPAFPGEQGDTPEGGWNQTFNPGMSLRQWYAGQALVGLLSYGVTVKVKDNNFQRVAARRAFALADAMIEFERQEGAKDV